MFNNFLGFSRNKIILLIIFAVILNLIPNGGICVDGLGFGYCIYFLGFPFSSIVVGEIDNVPIDDLIRIIPKEILGLLGNLLIIYLVISIFFWLYHKVKNK